MVRTGVKAVTVKKFVAEHPLTTLAAITTWLAMVTGLIAFALPDLFGI